MIDNGQTIANALILEALIVGTTAASYSNRFAIKNLTPADQITRRETEVSLRRDHPWARTILDGYSRVLGLGLPVTVVSLVGNNHLITYVALGIQIVVLVPFVYFQ